MNYLEYLLIALVLIVIAFAITKSKKKDFQYEVNKLVTYLGGKDNIINYEVNKSRFIVTLKNVDIVNKEAIQRLGAQGIVEIDNQLKIILGDGAHQLKKHIDDLKWEITFFYCFDIIRQNTTNKFSIIILVI